VGKHLSLYLAAASTGDELLPLRSYVNSGVTTTWRKSLQHSFSLFHRKTRKSVAERISAWLRDPQCPASCL